MKPGTGCSYLIYSVFMFKPQEMMEQAQFIYTASFVHKQFVKNGV